MIEVAGGDEHYCCIGHSGMRRKASIERVLRWRFEVAKGEAPPPPSAARLLELARPWWEKWPEMYQKCVEQLRRSQIGNGQSTPGKKRTGKAYPVPALVVRGEAASVASARMVRFSVCGSRLQIGFRMRAALIPAERFFEATFISATASQPLFDAPATMPHKNEYYIDTEIPGALAKDWRGLSVMHHMPFRLILRSGSIG
jgi:hypothetical protein